MTTRKTGRPTKLTPAITKKIVKALKAGATHDLAALYAGISRTTFYDWKARGEAGEEDFSDFSDAIALAEGKGAVELLEKIKLATKDPKEWRAGAWLLERRYPEQYGKQQLDIKHSGSVGLSWEQMFELGTQTQDTAKADDDDN